MSRPRAVLLLLLAVVLFSSNGFLIKLSTWPALPLNAGRSAVATLVIWAYLRRPHFTWSRAQIGGGLAYTATVVLFVLATKMTTAANAIFLQFTAPMWVALLSPWLLGEKPRQIDWIALLIVVPGMALFFGGDLSAGDLWGNIVAIGSGISLAFMTIFLRLQKDGSPTETALIGNALSILIGLPFLGGVSWSAPDLGIILILGIVQFGIPFIIFTTVIKHLRAIESILIQMLEPLLNPIWVVLIVGEMPAPLALMGAVIVLIGVGLRTAFMAKESTTT